MKRRTVTITAITLALLSVTVSAGAITWGEPDHERHPHVGTLIFEQNGSFYSCSGTLLSPTVMLTAGHCVEGGGNVNTQTWVRFTENAWEGFGDYGYDLLAWLNGEWIPAPVVIPHPLFDDYAEFPLTYDVGLVILSKRVKLKQYGVLPEPGFLETLIKAKDRKDRQFTAVGYGVQGAIKPFAGDDYARYQGQVSLIELNSAFAGGASAKFSNNPGEGNGSGGTCFGDSGGPLFHGDTNVIGAIVSWGITPCVGVDYQFRMDTRAALEFVTENLRQR